MRDRHLPRLCRSCRAPMARQEGTCWRCGAQWATEDEPRTALEVIAGGAGAQVAVGALPAIAVASEAEMDAERWANEGGSLRFEPAARVRA